MQNQKPFFSIIIPYYRGAKYIQECLNSVKQQTFLDYECLVINDGDIGVNLEEYNLDKSYPKTIPLEGIELTKQAQYLFDNIVGDDDRFFYYEKENGGQASAKNFALSKIKGKYILFLDNDDYYDANNLQNIYNQLTRLNYPKDLILAFPNVSEFELVDQQKKIHGKSIKSRAKRPTLANILIEIQVSITFACTPAKLLKNIKFREDLKVTESEEIIYNIFSYNKRVRINYLETVIVHKRIHPESQTVIDAQDSQIKAFKDLEKIFAEYKFKFKSPRLKLICFLSQMRFNLYQKKSFLSIILRKVFSAFSKLLSGWWI